VSSPARAWLAQWRAGVPPSLAACVEQAILATDTGARETVDALGDAAIACLRDALRIGDDRAAALHLLAAGALITAACDAAAGSERELADVAARFSDRELMSLFRDELSSDRA
jgi:hypothetical protein